MSSSRCQRIVGVIAFAATVLALRGQFPVRQWYPPRQIEELNGHGMTFDAARGRLVVFGGVRRDGTASRETYEWDGANWLQRTTCFVPAGRGPLVYDRQRNRVVLYTGASLFEWDGADWQALSPAVVPEDRTAHAIVYDAARQQVVPFGGMDPFYPWEVAATTWILAGGTWRAATVAHLPPARFGHAMAFDPIRQRVVLPMGCTFQLGMPYDSWLAVTDVHGNAAHPVAIPAATALRGLSLPQPVRAGCGADAGCTAAGAEPQQRPAPGPRRPSCPRRAHRAGSGVPGITARPRCASRCW